VVSSGPDKPLVLSQTGPSYSPDVGIWEVAIDYMNTLRRFRRAILFGPSSPGRKALLRQLGLLGTEAAMGKTLREVV
jgi:hypothetical protein